MILDPFPELTDRPTVIHIRTQAFSDRVAPFIRQTILGLRPFVDNVVLAPETDCANPPDLPVELVHKDHLRDPIACRSLAAYLRERYPAVRLVVGHMGNGTRVGRLLAERLGVPLVGIFGGSDVNVELVGDRYRDEYRQLLAIPSAHFLTVASYLRDKLLELGAPAERVFAWHRGVDLTNFGPAPRAMNARLRLLIAGRFLEVKGHEYAIRALAKLRGRAELALLGDGPLREPLEKLARELGVADDVRFLGHVPHREVVRQLRAADVYLHPSVTCSEGRVEGVPNAIMEAHACGLPVVATTSGGIGEVVLDGETGYLVPERDHAAIADRVGALIASAELRTRLGTRGRAHVQQEFDSASQSRRLAARLYHAIEAGELFAHRGWSLFRAHDGVKVGAARPPIDGARLSEQLANPYFKSSRKIVGPIIVGYKKAIYTTVFRPYLKFLGREISRFVGKELADQLAALTGASAPAHSARPPEDAPAEQRMNVARCLDCPHGTPATPWPDAPCPMDRGCLEALAHEFVPVARVRRAAPDGALALQDLDAPLSHADGSQAHVHYAGDLQGVADPAALFVELRRILAPGGKLTLDISPLPRGRDGSGLVIPFAQHLLPPALLGPPPRRDFGIDEVTRWASDAGLVVRAVDAPPRHEDPCEMHVQARFGALLVRTGLGPRSLARGFVATVESAQGVEHASRGSLGQPGSGESEKQSGRELG